METQDDFEGPFLLFYKELLGISSSDRKKVSQSIMDEGVTLNALQQVDVCGELPGEDVRRDLFSIDDNNAPGPDDYSSFFF